MPTKILIDMPPAVDTVQLEARLAAAGVPEAVVYAEGGKLVIGTEANLSLAVQQQIRDRVAAFRPRRPRAVEAIRDALAALTAAQRNTLLVRLLAELLQRDPGLARRAGLDIDGDEEALVRAEK